MTNLNDIEHDSEEDGRTEALTEPLAPELTATQERRADMRAARDERRKADTAQAIRERYSIREYPAGTEAENDDWLTLDNDAIFTRLGQ